MGDQISRLKPAVVKESNRHANSADIDNISMIFTKHRGNLEELAKIFGCQLAALQANPPKDGPEFAAKLFDGSYTGDSSDILKAALRSKLREELQSRKMAEPRKSFVTIAGDSGTLVRGSSRATVRKSVVGDAEMEKICALYNDNNGDMAKLCKLLDLTPELAEKAKPANPMDFAMKLLDGAYTGETNELQKSFFRKKLLANIHETRSSLKRTNTKEGAGEPMA